MNVILVIFDSLRKDCIGAYGRPAWWPVQTPHLDSLAKESLIMTRCYPESLPTLPARRAIYTGQRVYPFIGEDIRLKGDFVGAPGWGPIHEEQNTLAEILRDDGGIRTALISDLYHMFKPSKNFWRGFDQWTFLRGKEADPQRSGPVPTQEEIDYWLPDAIRTDRREAFVRNILLNMRDRIKEEDYFCPRVFIEAARWLEQNQDAERFFLLVESFDPHEPWFVPNHYRRMYDESNGKEQVISIYDSTQDLDPVLLRRTRSNYSGLVTMCDRWFGYFFETIKVLGLLENTLLIVTSDHGHSIGEKEYMGKRAYPSAPEVFDIPLLTRHPLGQGAGQESDVICQHTDIPALVFEAFGFEDKYDLHGRSFLQPALKRKSHRDHVTVGWATAMTVIDDQWWFNCKIDGTGPFLYDLRSRDPFKENVADAQPDVLKALFNLGLEDANGQFPGYLLEMAKQQEHAPGCSQVVARE